MKQLLFDSWHSWKVCFLSGCKKFLWGLVRIITCIVLGILSVIRWLWRLLRKAVGQYPTSAIIIAVLLCIGIYMFMFVTGRARLVTAEYQRDSLSYELSKFTQMYDSTATIIINGDTVRYGEELCAE